MKKLIWMAGGVIFVSAVFFIPGPNGNIWLSVLLSGVAALIYMTAISALWLKKIESGAVRLGITGTLAVFVVLSVMTGFVSYRNSLKENQNIVSTRSSIETGYLRANINEPLLATLRSYRESVRYQPSASLGAIFYAKYGSLIKKGSEFDYGDIRQHKTRHIYLAKNKADSVVLIGESTYLNGENPNFQNYSGKKGFYQVEGILTKKGVHYERTN